MSQEKVKTKHGNIELPAFMPDATYGSIKAISFPDAAKAGVKEIVTTTLHIEQKVGSKFIKDFGGVHKFFNWDRPILTDSGGWQVFSLINAQKKSHTSQNMITELGCSFINPDTGEHSLLTPESSQVIQYNLGSDIVTVLDDPIIGNASLKARTESVRLNTLWAARSKKKFLELHNITSETFDAYTSLSEVTRPLLGCVIQGADDFKLRKQSAEELIEIGFDIYNFGGIPLMSDVTWKTNHPTGFYKEMLQYVCDLIPKNKFRYAMGVGQPEDIAFCVEAGWQLFDTVLPTRNARHGYLYVSEGNGDVSKSYKSKKFGEMNYDIQHLKSERYSKDVLPVDTNCNCECCSTVSKSYLRHLIRIKEPAGFRLATIHNLSFYSSWMNELRKFKSTNQN